MNETEPVIEPEPIDSPANETNSTNQTVAELNNAVLSTRLTSELESRQDYYKQRTEFQS